MHGLVNKAVEAFAIETYGPGVWANTLSETGIGLTEFDGMLNEGVDLMQRLVDTLSRVTGNPRNNMLEDLGTFLVTSPSLPEIRRLMRFGGATYEEFLLSLDDLSDRVRLAVDDLALPQLALTPAGEGAFLLHCAPGLPGFGHVLVGVLRALADDYGTLAMLDHKGNTNGGEAISILIVEDCFSSGRHFRLGARSA